MDVQSASYPGNISQSVQGRSQNACEAISKAVYYVLGKARLINVNEKLLDSQEAHKDEDYLVTCEIWGSPMGQNIYMRKCAIGDDNKRFLKDEKYILRQAQGPNIISLIETDDDSLLMPYAGKTLHDLLTEPGAGLPYGEFKPYALQLMNGIVHLHDSRIWHLDLKPGNVLIDDEHHLTIIDFGLSQYVGPAEQKEVCTEGYKPPEMFYMGGKEISKKTDVFSAGVILFEMLTNDKLFPEGFDESRMRKQHIYYEYLNTRLKEVEAIDKQYAPLLKSMLAWHPKHRPTAQYALSVLK
ncbi:protein kinase domain-containing protein [Endozoicomonas numazuensis]|uniref:Protein kinase domain-containing protein n=1 Tax=Endozoicomonas numazuensis TaxID=1137799 RepID=A0A081NIC3_9GAMM|nr:protein kinase [Endozoicomonas numazuensis]KEQ18196.1 hypothetical protein GZ78_11685 [Endozoicomonas numazuensis]